jgi:hypothetical protein
LEIDTGHPADKIDAEPDYRLGQLGAQADEHRLCAKEFHGVGRALGIDRAKLVETLAVVAVTRIVSTVTSTRSAMKSITPSVSLPVKVRSMYVSPVENGLSYRSARLGSKNCCATVRSVRAR